MIPGLQITKNERIRIGKYRACFMSLTILQICLQHFSRLLSNKVKGWWHIQIKQILAKSLAISGRVLEDEQACRNQIMFKEIQPSSSLKFTLFFLREPRSKGMHLEAWELCQCCPSNRRLWHLQLKWRLPSAQNCKSFEAQWELQSQDLTLLHHMYLVNLMCVVHLYHS